MITIGDKEFTRLVNFVKINYGINLIHKRTLIESRLSNMLADRNIKGFSDYIDTVLNDKTGNEVQELLNKLTTNLTYFMREETHFSYFYDNVLPWIENTARTKDVRIWSAGCSTGEEPYTLAMLLADYFREKKSGWDTRVLATDLSTKVLDVAKKGIYSAELLEKVPKTWKLNYFKKITPDSYEIADTIKKEVIFGPFNLMEEILPFKKSFHVIFCRNVMIYFDQKTKQELVNRFYNATEPGGYLFIGHSETIDKNASDYRYIMPAVYRKGF